MNITVAADQKSGRYEGVGLAGWVLGWLRGLGAQSRSAQRQMKLLETLPLGGKRHLMLVSCGGRQYLVGGGTESVQTIVCVAADADGLRAGSGGESGCL
jgi:hypothetical protein